MTSFRFLQTGDIHVGKNRLTLGETDALKRGELLFEALYREADNNKCHAVLITGDIFDVKDVTNRERELVARMLAKYAGRDGIPTFVIPGNHDQTTKSTGNLDFLAEISKAGEIANLHVAFSTREELWDAAPGLKVIGAPCILSEDQKWVEDYVAKLPQDTYFVFMGHGSISGCVRNDSGNTAPGDKLSLAKASASAPQVVYWAYGDIHKRQPLPTLAPGAKGFYAGSPIQMDFGELPDRGVLIVRLDEKDGAWSYRGQRYVRIDTPENGFKPMITVYREEDLDSVPKDVLLKIDQKVVLSKDRRDQVMRTYKVMEDYSLPPIVNNENTTFVTEMVDPLTADVRAVEENVTASFQGSKEAKAEMSKVVSGAVDRFRNRSYVS